MKLLWILVLLPITVFADQISYQEGSQVSESDTYFVTVDRRFQYNYDINDKYVFLQYRRIGVCPSYCGFNYDMLGLGFGKNIKLDNFTLFAQAGYYFVDNSLGKTKYDENLYYYFRSKHQFGEFPGAKSYEVRNKDAFGLTLGVDVPMSENFGFKVSYQHFSIKENIIAYFTDPPKANSRLWWTPMNRKLSSIGAGLYYKF